MHFGWVASIVVIQKLSSDVTVEFLQINEITVARSSTYRR